MEAVALAFGAGALLLSIVALILALGVAVRVRNLEEDAHPPRAGLPVGAPVPRQPLTELLGGNASWLDRSLVLFASASCEPCRDLVAGLSQGLTPTQMPVILVEPGSVDGSFAGLLQFPATRVSDEDGTVRMAFQAHATPHTFLVRDGRVAEQQLGADVERVLAMISGQPAEIAAKAGSQ